MASGNGRAADASCCDLAGHRREVAEADDSSPRLAAAMKKIDLASVPVQSGSSYPPPFEQPCSRQASQRLARHAGLTLLGVNLTVIEPGCWSSQRHWHSHEDEFVWVVD